MRDELPFGPSRELPAFAPAERPPSPQTPLYSNAQPRNRMVPCGVCQKPNHETRLWCTSCGHQMGVPLAECVCEACVHGHGG